MSPVPALDPCAVDGGAAQQLLQQVLGLEIEEVVNAEEHQRQHHSDEALIFQLLADLGHQPAQHTGQRQYEHGQQEYQQHAADHGGGRCRRGHPVDDDRRQHHHAAVHQAHQVHAQQAGCHQGVDGDGHAQQQVVVLGQIQPGVGVEHAAEGAQQRGQQGHQREVQPVQTRGGQRRTQSRGQDREHAAQDHHHQHREQHDVGGHCRLGAGLVGLGVIEIVAEDLRQLLFQKDAQHVSSSSSRNTCSRESSPLTSSMVPERMRRPPLMMATLSHSFSATSSTWVEKKMAPP